MKRISVSCNELMAKDFEKSEHSEQDGFSIMELAEELPFSVANAHKQ
jgi:hypothetical protein